jgi:hypothetical protein
MNEHAFCTCVSKPYTGCTSCEQLRTILLFNWLVITLVIFWHIVIGMEYGKVVNKRWPQPDQAEVPAFGLN